jgi:teichuronic acid biosynthesis glycosyltransferase TuaG
MSNVNNMVSIIMPAYRAASLIQESINSVLSQTYPNWELLIADDCSPDGTAAVAESASFTDKRIKLIRCKVNGGPAAARNAAIAEAQGRWVAFLDSDDLWLPQKLESTIRHARENQSAITFTSFRRISYDLAHTGRLIKAPKSLSYRELLGNTAIATSTVLIDRSLVGEFHMKKVYYDDYVCWLEILKKGFVAHGLNEDLMRYRVVSNSVSRNKKRSAQEVWKIYTKVENLGFFKSAFYFSNYALNAFLKYRNF